jgi:hypothetical protein
VRLTLLEKFGGVWFDASVICTSPVESWALSDDQSKITMFLMHANCNVHGNWTMAAGPGHPLISTWRAELAKVLDEVGPGVVPEEFCKQAFIDFPALDEIWNTENPPPLPYLWAYLVLQIALLKLPELHSTIDLKPSLDGPMYCRYKYNIGHHLKSTDLSAAVAEDLAHAPFSLEKHDKYFVKLVGKDREHTQLRLDSGEYDKGSALDQLNNLRLRSVVFGLNMQQVVGEKFSKLRAATNAVIATQRMTLKEKRQSKTPMDRESTVSSTDTESAISTTNGESMVSTADWESTVSTPDSESMASTTLQDFVE